MTAARPTFSWHLPAGVAAGVLELCRDRACARPFLERGAAVSFTPSADLPSGMIYWRVRGKSGGLVGKPSAIRALAVDTTVTWSGRYVDVVVPASDSAFGQRLVPLLDRAVDEYVQYLGVSAPSQKVPIFFYVTDAAYLQARRDVPPKHEAGFTLMPASVWDRRHPLGCHIRYGTRLTSDDAATTGDVESIVLHELAHAVAFEAMPLYQQLPAWWIEGMSDLLSSKAMADIWHVPLERQPLMSERLRFAVREKSIPLDELLSLEHGTISAVADPEHVGMVYAEGFALLQYLDSPSHPDRQRAFREVVKSIASLSKLTSATKQLKELVHDLKKFEFEWRTALAETTIFPWMSEAQLRVSPAEVEVGAWPAHLAIAYFGGATAAEPGRLAPGDRVEALVDVHAGDEPSGCLVVSTADRARYGFCANDRGKARLVRLGEPTQKVATGTVPSGLFAPGARARLSLELRADRWIGSVDGNVAIDVAAPAAAAMWGVAADSGHAHFLGAHVTRAPASMTMR